MKRIGQKQLSLLLCLVLLFTMATSRGARASDYFNNTYVSATAVGGGTLRIKVDVAASGIMQELGATEIIVHERQANGTYKPVRTFTRNQNANLIRKNCASNVISLTYKGTPGKYYYITAHCYAKNASGTGATWIWLVNAVRAYNRHFSFSGRKRCGPKIFYFFDPNANKSGWHDMYRGRGAGGQCKKGGVDTYTN